MFSVQIRHRHRFWLELCFVFWAESIRTRFFLYRLLYETDF